MRSTREYHANLCHQSLKMEQKEKQNKVDLSTTGKGHFIMQETMVIMLFNGRIWYMNLFFLFKQFCHSVPLGTCKHCQFPTLASHKLKFSQHSDYIDFSFWTLGKRNRFPRGQNVVSSQTVDAYSKHSLGCFALVPRAGSWVTENRAFLNI